MASVIKLSVKEEQAIVTVIDLLSSLLSEPTSKVKYKRAKVPAAGKRGPGRPKGSKTKQVQAT